MTFENSKTCNSHRLILNLLDKINLKISSRCAALSNLNIYYTWKNTSQTNIINLKYQLRHRAESLNYLMDHILYQIFEINLNVPLKIWDSS